MKNISPEDSILIEAGNPFKADAEKRLLRTLKRWKDSINWNHLLENAEKNCIIPQIYYLLENIEKSYIPSRVLEKLERLYLKSVIIDLQTRSTLKEMLRILKGIKFVLMKGYAVAQYYPEQTIRSSVDIDILIPTIKTLKEACEKLIHAGYECGPQTELRWEPIRHLIFTKKDRITIEVHKETQWGHYRAIIDKEKLLQNAIPSKIENREFLVVSPEDNVLLTCIRLFDEGFFVIRDLVDINVILTRFKESFDWNYLLKRAKADTLDLALFCILYLSSYLYTHELIPENVLNQFKNQFSKKFLFSLLAKTRISLPLLWNSNIRHFFLIYGLCLKFKQEVKFFISRVRKFGFRRGVWDLILDRILHPINFEFLKKLFP